MNNLATILICTICYCVVFTITAICKKNKSNRLFDATGLPAFNAGYLMALHIAGIFWLAVIPMLLLKHSFSFLSFNCQLTSIFWLAFLFVLILFAAFTGLSASRKISTHYSNTVIPANSFLAFYFIIRILFLCAYEIFFRGFLLFGSIERFGIFPAILLSTALTVLIHVFTNKKEMLGCVPFGFILCILCIVFNSVWPAIAIHITLSLSFEIPTARNFLHHLKTIK